MKFPLRLSLPPKEIQEASQTFIQEKNLAEKVSPFLLITASKRDLCAPQKIGLRPQIADSTHISDSQQGNRPG